MSEREAKLKLKEEELLKREDLVVRKELQIQARERELSCEYLLMYMYQLGVITNTMYIHVYYNDTWLHVSTTHKF